MSFDSPSNMFGRSSAIQADKSIIDTLFDTDGKPLGQVTIVGSIGQNAAVSARIANLLEMVLRGEEVKSSIDLGFLSQYSLNENQSILNLRFIDPEHPSVSKTMVTAALEEGAFTHDIAQAILSSFVLPEGQLPKFDKKALKPTPA